MILAFGILLSPEEPPAHARINLSPSARYLDYRTIPQVLKYFAGVIGTDPIEIPQKNVTPPTDYQETARDLDAISKHNVLDNELVAFARELLVSI